LVKSGGGGVSGESRVTGGWFVADLPLCILLGAGVGALLSFSTAAATAIARVKRSVMAGGEKRRGKKKSSSRAGEIVAAVFPVAFVSVLAFVLPLLFSCRVRQDHVKGKPEVSHLLASGQHQVDHRMFVRFTCQQGEYNDLASLLLPSLSGSFASTMSHLYSRDSDEETYGDASLATLATCYYFFPLFIIGCSFPFGLFVPNLVFGSAAGHLFGRLVNRSAWVGSSRVAHPTTYAVLGAGAALGGWTRMAIAISAIMLEQTGNMDSVILMMVTVLSSRLVAGFLTPHSFTDEVISMKGYQVLEPREPAVIATLSAGEVCTRDVVCLRADETVAGICRALIHTTHNAFPVVRDENENENDTGSVSRRDKEKAGKGVEHNFVTEPVWRVETGGHAPSPTLLGLVSRSTLLGILERAVNARRPSERRRRASARPRVGARRFGFADAGGGRRARG
jgi:chloride channel 7